MIKNILFKIDLEGNGIVNYDSNKQKFTWNKYVSDNGNLPRVNTNYENVSFGKKNWFNTDDNKLDYKLKISSDCLRHNIFADEIPFQSPNISINKYLLLSFIASPASIVRGYMFTESETDKFKRTTSLNITDAVQTCKAKSTIETFSKSGAKTTDNENSDNTFFFKETVGDIFYSCKGNIDLMNLQFLSCDQIFDRLALNPDYFNSYKEILKNHLPTFNSELKHYNIKNSCNVIPEYGVKFSNVDILFLIKYIMKKLLTLNITHLKSFARVKSLQYKLVVDPIEDTFEKTEGWVSVTNNTDIENINFNVEDFYIEVDETKAKKLREEIENDIKNNLEAKKKRKDENADKKGKNKKISAPEINKDDKTEVIE